MVYEIVTFQALREALRCIASQLWWRPGARRPDACACRALGQHQ